MAAPVPWMPPEWQGRRGPGHAGGAHRTRTSHTPCSFSNKTTETLSVSYPWPNASHHHSAWWCGWRSGACAWCWQTLRWSTWLPWATTPCLEPGPSSAPCSASCRPCLPRCARLCFLAGVQVPWDLCLAVWVGLFKQRVCGRDGVAVIGMGFHVHVHVMGIWG